MTAVTHKQIKINKVVIVNQLIVYLSKVVRKCLGGVGEVFGMLSTKATASVFVISAYNGPPVAPLWRNNGVQDASTF